MVELIAFIIFIFSVIAIFFVLLKKTPALTSLPKNGHHGIKKHKIILSIENKIKTAHFNLFKNQMWLHKFLSWIKIWILKIEDKIDQLLSGIRKKAQHLDKETKKKK